MAEKQYNIGSQGPFKYDDAAFPAALDTDGTIRASTAPIGGSDILRLDDIGGGGPVAPHDAKYVVISLDADLSNERVLAVNTANLSLVDGGAGGNITLDTIQNIDVTATPQFAKLGIGEAIFGDPLLYVAGISYFGRASVNGDKFVGVIDNEVRGFKRVAGTIGSGSGIDLVLQSNGGYVGIGTASPGDLLHVSGGNILLDNARQIRMKDAGGAKNNVLILTSAAHIDELILGAGSGIDNLSLCTGGTRRLFIDPTGKVGLNTVSPTGLLTLDSGALEFEGGLTAYPTLNGSSAIYATEDPGSGSYPFNNYGHLVLQSRRSAGTGNDGDIVFVTNFTPAIRMVIKDSGLVGIGTASPQELLHVGAGTDASDITATDLLVTRAGPSNLSVRDSTNNVETFLFASSVGGIMGTVTNDPLNIQTNNTLAIFIDSAQKVGINEVAPDEKLEVNGNVHITGDTYWTGDGSGVPYGAMGQENIPTTVTINTAGTAEIVLGMTGGETNLATFQNSRELKVTKAGRYLITWAVSFNMASGSGQEVEGAIGKGGTAQSVGSAHRKIGTANDTGSMCGNGFLDLAADDLITIMVANETSTVDVVIAHASLTLMMAGGT